MAKLWFKYGAMGASKSAIALMTVYNYKEKGLNPLLLQPKISNRDGYKHLSELFRRKFLYALFEVQFSAAYIRRFLGFPLP